MSLVSFRGISISPSRLATPGKVVNVFLAILIGSFSLALLAPEMQGLYP